MTDRDRLIDILKASVYGNIDDGFYGPELNFENVADYLLANGVIVPPCKVGDNVYYLAHNLYTKTTKIKIGTVLRIAITKNGIDLFVDNWTAKLPYGKRSFLTEEEAEKALKEREG